MIQNKINQIDKKFDDHHRKRSRSSKSESDLDFKHFVIVNKVIENKVMNSIKPNTNQNSRGGGGGYKEGRSGGRMRYRNARGRGKRGNKGNYYTHSRGAPSNRSTG
eukprot:357861_1